MIRWIKEYLGTSSYEYAFQQDVVANLVDVRDLVDKAGNSPQKIREKIDEGLIKIKENGRVIVCCDYGISRSNAVAAGILSKMEKMPFHRAVREVIQTTNERNIKIEVLDAVRKVVSKNERNNQKQFDNPAILVTGSGGYIGNVVSSALADKYALCLPIRQELDLLSGASSIYQYFEQNNIAQLLHLAQPDQFGTNEALGDALVMLKNLIDVCRIKSTRLIFLSSLRVFSSHTGTNIEVDENSLPCPIDAYSETKYLSELFIKESARVQDLSFQIIRTGTIYGTSRAKPKFLETFIRKAISNENIYIHSYINGPPLLNMVHIDDLSVALLRAVESDFSGVLHFGSNRLSSTYEIAECVKKLTGSRSNIIQLDIEGYHSNIYCNNKKAEEILGCKPEITIENGIKMMLDKFTESEGVSQNGSY